MSYKANILLVDDREENLTGLEAILSSLDQNLVRANSGEAALKALLERDFAVILLDVVMPGMDGFETATHIKQREKTKDIPIIFLTASTKPEIIEAIHRLKNCQYLAKPINSDSLEDMLQRFARQHQ